jgi:predicted ATPase
LTRGAVAETEVLAERFRGLLGRADEPLGRLYAYGCPGVREAMLGEFVAADRNLGLATDECEKFAGTDELGRLPYGGAVYPPGFWAWVLCMRGEGDRAREAERRMRGVAKALDNAYGHALSGHFSALIAVELLDVDAALALANRQVAFSTEQAIPLWQLNSQCLRGWARAHRGEPEEGAREVETSLAGIALAGMRSANSAFLAFRADAQLQAGALDAALASVEEGLAMAETSLDRFYHARLKQIRAGIERARGDRDAAQGSLREAIAFARGHGAHWHELLAALDLARSGEREEGVRHIRPLYERMAGLFDAPPLREARDLLGVA